MPEVIFNPQPVQKRFLEAKQRIVFFGGGAGGGKTWAALVDNLQGVHDPDYFSVFFRTTNTEIDTGLWPEAKKLYKDMLFDEDDKPIGRLHVALESGYRNSDEEPIFILNLTARGAPRGDGIDGVLGFLDVGREWVVRGFASVTTPTMHKEWGRKDDT